MSEYGAGITAKRKDETAITEAEAEKLAGSMNAAAKSLGICGFFEEESDCDLGWEEDDGGYHGRWNETRCRIRRKACWRPGEGASWGLRVQRGRAGVVDSIR